MSAANDPGTRLILMRHAKSDWYSGADDDFSRPLADRGVRDARRMGGWLVRQGCRPERVLCSPARRARETLVRLSAGAGLDLEARTCWEEALYPGSPEAIRATLARHAGAGEVMLIGHNPGLEDFLAWLVPAAELRHGFSKTFPTAAIYVLTAAPPLDALARGCARIAAHQRPKLLSD